MSEVFASATVHISPVLTSFRKDLEEDLVKIMAKVKVPPVRVRPALTVDFVGDLRRQVDAAILKAQKGIKPIRVKALIEPVGVSGRVPAGVGGSVGKGGIGGGLGRAPAANALARSLEHVTTAQLNLNRAFDETLPLQDQVAAVTKVTTALDSAQTAAENTLAKAIVAKNTALQKSARRQLADIEDFRGSIAGRVTQTAAITPVAAPPSRPAGVTSARAAGIAGLRSTVQSMKETDVLEQKLTKDTKDLAAAQEIAHRRATELSSANKAVTASLKSESSSLKIAAANTQALSKIQNAAAKARVTGVNQAIKAEKELDAAQRKSAATAQAAARKSTSAAAAQARSEKRRSEQLTRGSQASVLSLAGIRGATLAASRSFLVGAAAITVFARAVKQFADLERNLDVFRATTSATADQMEAVREEATKLGADLTLPSVAAGDAAGAMVELAKAGLSVQDSIDGARAVLELSTAAAIDNADAVRLVANVLNAFSLAGRDAGTVADTLANAANAAQGSIADIGVAFQQAASAGHQVGLSFQDTATFLTILAKNGLRGSDAGTSLRTALIRLVNPSKEAKAQLESLGIVLRDAAGNLRPDVFLQIAAATSRLTPAARDATIALIGGQDAFRAVTILGRQSADAFLAMRAALHRTGTAAELAEARTRGLHGAMDGLQSVLETIGTTTAGHVGPALANFVRTVSSGLTAFSESNQVARTLNQTLGATSDAFHVLGVAIQGVGVVALPVLNTLSKLITSIGVGTILAGVVAWKAFNAVLDGAILRMTILRPLIAQLAVARIGSSLATGFTEATLALQRFNKERGIAVAVGSGGLGGAPLTGFARLAQVEKEIAVNAAAAAPKVSALGVLLRGLGGFAVANLPVAAVAALAAGVFILATRQSASEKAASSLAKATDALASAYGRAKAAAQELASTERAVQQQGTGLQQAVLNKLRAQAALDASTAAPGSPEGRQLTLDLAIATQDVTFATQDYNKVLKDLKTTQEDQASASDQQTQKFNDQRDALLGVLAAGASFSEVASGDTNKIISGSLKDIFRLAQVLKTLDSQSKKNIASGDKEKESLGRRQAALKGLLTAMKLAHRESLKPIIITTLLKAPNVAEAIKQIVAKMKFGSEEARREFIKTIIDMSGLGPAMRRSLEAQLLPHVAAAVHTAAEWARRKGGPELGVALAEGAAEGFKATFDVSDIVANALAQGLSSAQTLAQLQAQKPGLQAKFNRINKATKGGTSFKSQDQQDAFEKARDDLNTVNAEIARITGEIAQKSKDAAQKIKDAQTSRDEAQQKVIDSLLNGRKATALQRKITSAGLTEWLGDDLKTTAAWLNYLKNLAKTLPARLKAAGASKDLIVSTANAISDLIFETTNAIKKIGADIKKNTEDRKKALFDLAIERTDLRIQIAQSRENIAAELRARRARLDVITKELVRVKHALGRNSIEWLRLKAEQIAEIAAIRDLNAELDKKKNVNAEFQFKFLQTQAGFAANLLGNLIPGFATAGLVGGSGGGGGGGGTGGGGGGGGPLFFGREPGTGGPFPGGGRFGGVASKGRDPGKELATQSVTVAGGPTHAGQSRELKLLHDIKEILLDIRRGNGHPNAKHVRATGAVSSSGAGGGGSGADLF